MRRPSKFGTMLLAIFLIGTGALPILRGAGDPAYTILHIVAIAAGILIWMDR